MHVISHTIPREPNLTHLEVDMKSKSLFWCESCKAKNFEIVNANRNKINESIASIFPKPRMLSH